MRFERCAGSADGDGGKREIERLLRQRPEIPVAAGEAPHPAIFELLGAPDLGETRGIRAECRRVLAHGRMHVEERAVSVEGKDGAGQREPPPEEAREGVDQRS